MIAGIALLGVVAGTLTGCYVESRPRWHPYYHRQVVVIPVR